MKKILAIIIVDNTTSLSNIYRIHAINGLLHNAATNCATL